MPIPPFRGLGPSEAIKQLAQWVNQPMLTSAFREAAQKLGIREVPSLSSLQEVLRQAGRWIDVATEPWSDTQTQLLVPGINATGELFSGRWTVSKLSPEALAILNLIYTNTVEDTDAERHCSRAILSSTGSADALITPNLGIAIHLVVLGLNAAQRIERVVLPRTYSIRIPTGPSHGGSMLPEMLEACGVPVREIGSNRECLESDYERALDTPKQLLLVSNFGPRDAALQSGFARAAANDCLVCELAFDGSLHDLNDLGMRSDALTRRWDHGPDLMIVPGQYLLGGPECGIILGKKDLIQAIRKLAEGTGMLACRATHLLLTDTIRNTDRREGWNASPVGSALSNSLANLENRAKRIAAQCQTTDSDIAIETCTKLCPIGSGVWHEIALPSAVLRVIPPQGTSPSRIAERLAQHTPAIWCNVFSDHLEIVLRSIDPAEDSVVVNALCSLSSDTNPDESKSPASSF